MSDKILVVLSGGQDSTTCLFLAIREVGAENVRAIGFDYGQRHKVELELAGEVCREQGVPFEVLRLPLLNDLTANALTRPDVAVDAEKPGDGVPNTCVDGRNMLFLTYAAIYAKSKGMRVISCGVGEGDYSGYPDCRAVFARSLNETLCLAMDYDFQIVTPLMNMTKAATWKLAEDLGILGVIREKTISCYNGERHGCGNCPACQLREKGYKQFMAAKQAND